LQTFDPKGVWHKIVPDEAALLQHIHLLFLLSLLPLLLLLLLLP